MVWINSCPQGLVPLVFKEEIIKIIHVPHTPLLVILTSIGVYVYDQYTLLPLVSHIRNQDSINQHGHNVNIKTKHVSVNTALLQKLNSVNFFVQTNQNYLILYHCSINYTTSLFEVSNSKNDEVIQTGLPLSVTSQKFTFTKFVKSATRSIIQGNQDISINLENIEHFNNGAIEDELGNFQIENAKLSIFKILKIGIGLNRYWLKQNSHNLIVFNNKNERNNSIIEESESISPSIPEENCFQIVNMQSFKNEVFHLADYSWYESGEDSKIIYINYNVFKNYFIFLNAKGQLWYFKFDVHDDHVIPKGHLLTTFPGEDLRQSTFKFAFNPQSNLLLLQLGIEVKLYKVNHDTFEFVKHIDVNISHNTKLIWSSCGNFFIILDKQSSKWTLFTKFGSISFNTNELLKELDENYEHNRDFLRASDIIITPNSNGLNILSEDKKTLYYVNLLKVNDNACFYDNEYISIIQNNRSLVKFPLLPKFKRILSRLENYNGNSNKSLKSVNGIFNMSRNESNQIALSYGEHLALSTPLTTDGNDINHVLWFNFRNYYLDSLNIVHQFWYNDYLIIVNRKQGQEYDTEEDSNAQTNDDKHLVDEIIIFDTSVTKYGAGGGDIKFDNDLMLWKYDFKTTLIDIQPVKFNDKVTHLVLITDDYRLIIIELNNSRTIAKTTSSSNLQNPTTQRSYKIFIGVNKTIHLSSIKHRFAIKDIIKTSMIDKRHFIFLLGSGDIYLLKNQSTTGSFANPVDAVKPSNMYDLIRIGTGIEFFKFKSIKFDNDKQVNYIYLFNGDSLLVYEINDLISNSYDKENELVLNDNGEGIEDIHHENHHTEPDPIRIDIDNYQPLILDSIISDDFSSLKSIDLIGLEHAVINKISSGMLIMKSKVSHKLVLNNFMEYDLIHKSNDKNELIQSFKKFQSFKNYSYCLELLLFKYLTRDEETKNTLKKLITLIELTKDPASVYINCLRKIEVGYWDNFFTVLDTTPVKFMTRLIESENVEDCYNYLIVYLNFKKEGDEDETTELDFVLNSNDEEIILKIMKMLDKSQKWDWCFELCRFIKLLQPSGDLLRLIKEGLQ